MARFSDGRGARLARHNHISQPAEIPRSHSSAGGLMGNMAVLAMDIARRRSQPPAISITGLTAVEVRSVR